MIRHVAHLISCVLMVATVISLSSCRAFFQRPSSTSRSNMPHQGTQDRRLEAKSPRSLQSTTQMHWSCFRTLVAERVNGIEGPTLPFTPCYRAASECETERRRAVKWAEWGPPPGDVLLWKRIDSRCWPRKKAACFDIKHRLNDTIARRCFADAAECVRVAATMRADSTHFLQAECRWLAAGAARAPATPLNESRRSVNRAYLELDEICFAGQQDCESECAFATIETYGGTEIEDSDFESECIAACESGNSACGLGEHESACEEFRTNCSLSCPMTVYDYEHDTYIDDTNADFACDEACQQGAATCEGMSP
jgi:hypothetical protein